MSVRPWHAATATVGAGALIAVQGHLNGALTERIGAPEFVTLISFLQGAAVLSAAVAIRARAAGSRPRDPACRRLTGWPRWWLSSGPLGAFLVVAVAASVPLVGVALVTVLTVVGQTITGVLLDAAGHGGPRRMPVTGRRMAAIAIAIAALAFAALGSADGALEGATVAGLTLLLVVAGAAAAVQQAANGDVTTRVGDPALAALASFAVGALVLAAVTVMLLVADPGRLAGPWPPVAEAWLYSGGFAGLIFVVATAWVVPRLGVLTVALAGVAGSLIGALGLEAASGSAGLDFATVAASVAVLVSVVVAGASPREPEP